MMFRIVRAFLPTHRATRFPGADNPDTADRKALDTLSATISDVITPDCIMAFSPRNLRGGKVRSFFVKDISIRPLSWFRHDEEGTENGKH
ncbi:hypothetical protein MICA_574 [Micavibrio aeruginosavorus ARL-13]|uniref:Uncharacterized protein n=1 Tax=Micavibrio aeruginosavorus (strain ARL-13) TaxID=856793 RepID=G2KMX9_MICAA|nr:hypothetical protein MICA_574 [Micavibrio aeruginosavorus ARL-13]